MFTASTKVLVLDDMNTMRKIVIKACQGMGFKNIIDAADGQKGWEALEAAQPPVELVISDWNMPNCTGLELLKKVRSDARFKNLPFILVTAETEKEQIVEAIKAGVSNYVVKPFTPEILAKKIQEVAKRLSKQA